MSGFGETVGGPTGIAAPGGLVIPEFQNNNGNNGNNAGSVNSEETLENRRMYNNDENGLSVYDEEDEEGDVEMEGGKRLRQHKKSARKSMKKTRKGKKISRKTVKKARKAKKAKKSRRQTKRRTHRAPRK
jgi:hypothetical protein